MRVDELKIRGLIRRYKETEDDEILIEIVKEISDMIYNYPRIVFGRTEDDCSEFYLYVIEQIKKIIVKYNEALASFNTWFTIVLKSRYINWLYKIAREKEKRIEPVLWSDISADSNMKQDERIFYNLYLTQQNYEDFSLKDRLKNAYKKMDLLENLLIKLMYYPLDSSTISMLSEFLKKPLQECYDIYIKTYHKHNLLDKQKILRETANEIKHKLSKIKEKIEYFKRKDKPDKVKSLLRQKKINQKLLKETQHKYYKNISIIDIDGLQEILGLSKSEIYKKIRKIKTILAEELSDFVR